MEYVSLGGTHPKKKKKLENKEDKLLSSFQCQHAHVCHRSNIPPIFEPVRQLV